MNITSHLMLNNIWSWYSIIMSCIPYSSLHFARKWTLLQFFISNSCGEEFQNVGGNEKRHRVWSKVLCTCKDRHELSQRVFARPNHIQVQEWTTSEDWYHLQVGHVLLFEVTARVLFICNLYAVRYLQVVCGTWRVYCDSNSSLVVSVK